MAAAAQAAAAEEEEEGPYFFVPGKVIHLRRRPMGAASMAGPSTPRLLPGQPEWLLSL